MIYLIDDKKIRQTDNGWPIEKLNSFKNVLAVIHLANELNDEIKKEIFKDSNVILFHESFFDNPNNRHIKDGNLIRQKLIDYANANKTILVFFSGSIGNRTIQENIAYLPTNILYSNLEVFINSYNSNQAKIDQLVYGNNYEQEEKLLIKQKIWNILYDLDSIPKNNTIFESELSKLNLNIFNNKIEDLKTLRLLINEI
ncbi:hypothetical protein Flavo103_02480 [Flavobacterium collinsii]|uniref:hypothetical protein n=1 Tax=Flavobacterium collinsii TaxID=1114861 RepID=UPI0022CC1AE5|nr:hypothetical protein [Flavobacterium collinsii]GIQ57112.1 hypothetical protein Flavo103_02480 [Flavobacterium collinsii]